MKTIVYQVWGGQRPPWIVRCTDTVERWASARAYEYRLLDRDGFVDDAPQWIIEACGNTLIHPVLDYARVAHAERYLSEGWERAVWFDADVLVTRPALLELPTTASAFMAETWSLWTGGTEVHKHRVTNCICSFVSGDPFTGDYLRLMHRFGSNGSPMKKASLGTDLLTSLPEGTRPMTIANVGSLSPHALAAIVRGDAERVRRFIEETGESLYAVNICASHEGADYAGVKNTQDDYATVVDRLLTDEWLLDFPGSG